MTHSRVLVEVFNEYRNTYMSLNFSASGAKIVINF